ncbi:MAG: metallophosphoesterase [Acidobacteria bacterium]|nr:metallophosphoesterase [Acidobacteriota bacterium]
MRVVTSDWHLIDGSREEPCDRDTVARIVAYAVARQAEELILAGDIVDLTRDRDAIETGAAALAALLRPAVAAGIPVTAVAGNHDPFRLVAGRLAPALARYGLTGPDFTITNGPLTRFPWSIEHGHRWDPACCGGPLTAVGEAATRLDHVLDHVGVDLDPLGAWHPGPGEDRVLDHPTHRAMARWAASRGAHLVVGHTHLAHALGGAWGRTWRVLNCGAATKRAPATVVWITDEGEGGVEPL